MDLIKRLPEPNDARFFQVVLSQQGRAVMDIISSEWASVDREIEAAIGCHDADELHRITLHLRNAFGGRSPHAKLDSKMKD